MMQNVDYFATMARYNHWMNDRLYTNLRRIHRRRAED
jgi:uncharacterized damage-inducible protein DinB